MRPLGRMRMGLTYTKGRTHHANHYQVHRLC